MGRNVTDMTLNEHLDDLSLNLRWAWHSPTWSLFRDLDPELWEQVGHNPVALLRRLDRDRLEGTPELTERVQGLWTDLHDYLAGAGWYDADEGEMADRPLSAYFCAEFGITECLRIYSGGLGILAGDHLKSASDLGVPLVAMGMLYREGYFQQQVSSRGGQREAFPAVDEDDLPLREVRRPDDSPLRVAVPFPGRQVFLKVWRADVGRVPLFLLDADVPENADEDRRLTARLYGGDQEMRIGQEIILGMGGYRALREMGIEPRSFHMNEGHSAFLGLDLVRDLMESESLRFEDAVESAARRCVFTTHTPVPAGHDRFQPSRMARYFTAQARTLGVDLDTLLGLGREDPSDDDEPFTMTILAIRLADQVNGVSRLHGQVSRGMWQGLWPERSEDDVPIDHITNGVHLPSWIAPEVGALYGMDVQEVGVDARVPEPTPEALWQARMPLRRRLLELVESRTGAHLDPEALTIAFARRFATYKRATLVLEDTERLEALLTTRPVQLIFAGKAHPRDEGGKALIRRIGELAAARRFRHRVVFLPGYEIDIARYLVQGADVWLNNPRRPMEASGTSGMKAAANGVLNVSILDGWWEEGWEAASRQAGAIGWAIGTGLKGEHRTQEQADRADRDDLFRVLEQDVIPTFYDRDGSGMPARWAEMMRASIRHVAPFFNTHRMVRDYTERYGRAAEEGVLGRR